MEDKGLDMHGLHHEQWNRDRVPGFERLQWKRDVYVASDRRSCPCSDRRSGDEAAETAAKTSGDTLHVGYQQEVQEFQQAMQRKRDGRPFLCKAGTAPMSVPLWRQVNIVNIVNIVTTLLWVPMMILCRRPSAHHAAGYDTRYNTAPMSVPLG
jgi:hypothetical protein